MQSEPHPRRAGDCTAAIRELAEPPIPSLGVQHQDSRRAADKKNRPKGAGCAQLGKALEAGDAAHRRCRATKHSEAQTSPWGDFSQEAALEFGSGFDLPDRHRHRQGSHRCAKPEGHGCVKIVDILAVHHRRTRVDQRA